MPGFFVKKPEAGPKTDPDLELVVAYVRRRSPEAFRLLYERYRDKVYSTAFQVTGDATEALDVTQEVFLRIHRKLDRFRFESAFSSWLYRLTVNLATDFRRRRRSHRMLSIDGAVGETESSPAEIESHAPGPVAQAAAEELSRQVLEALSVLSPRLREVVVLRYLQRLSYEEVAQVIGKPVGTVKSRLNRAHEKLRPVLEELSRQQ